MTYLVINFRNNEFIKILLGLNAYFLRIKAAHAARPKSFEPKGKKKVCMVKGATALCDIWHKVRSGYWRKQCAQAQKILII